MARMTPAQRAHLEKKINALYGYTAQQAAQDKFKKPDTVQIAKYRATLKEFDKENERRRDVVRAAFDRASYEAKEAILFMEPAEALAYVNALKPPVVG